MKEERILEKEILFLVNFRRWITIEDVLYNLLISAAFNQTCTKVDSAPIVDNSSNEYAKNNK